MYLKAIPKYSHLLLYLFLNTELICACHLTQYLFIRDKKKEFAPNHAAYNPFGVDVFLSQRKVDHIARFVELPVISSSGELPPILVVNVQVLPLLILRSVGTITFVGLWL